MIERWVSQKIITVGVFANSWRIGLPIHVRIGAILRSNEHLQRFLSNHLGMIKGIKGNADGTHP